MYQKLPSWKPAYGATGPVEVPARGILRRQSSGGKPRRDQRVDRKIVVKPLGKLQPRLDPLHQLFARCGITLFDELPVRRRRRGACGVEALDGERATLRRPVVVDLADHQLRWRLRSEP